MRRAPGDSVESGKYSLSKDELELNRRTQKILFVFTLMSYVFLANFFVGYFLNRSITNYRVHHMSGTDGIKTKLLLPLEKKASWKFLGTLLSSIGFTMGLVYSLDRAWRVCDALKAAVEYIFEDPVIWWPWEQRLRRGYDRQYSVCECGAELYDDNNSPQGSSSQMGAPHSNFISSFRNIGKSSARAFSRVSSFLKRRYRPSTSNAHSPTGQTWLRKIGPSFLLLCVNIRWQRSRMVNIPIQVPTNDHELFQAMRRDYYRLRSWRRFLSLKSIHNVKFVKFELYYQDFVSCYPSPELPPPTDIDYHYDPKPAVDPPPNGPVLSSILLHNFEEPHICGTSCKVLAMLPKKLNRRLESQPEHVKGWGLQCVEGWSVLRFLLAAGFFISLGALSVLVARFGGNCDMGRALAVGQWVTGLAAAALVILQLLQQTL